MEDFLTAPHWARIGVRKRHGIVVPISALITEDSTGIGEFLDLIPLIRWLPKTGFDLLQVLPINDTGDDPSPYMALSSHALHPIYLSLRALPDAQMVPGFLSGVEVLAQLNSTPRVCYQEVLEGKLRLLSLYLDHRLEALMQTAAFQQFYEEHQSWLTPYSIFKAIKKAQGGSAWWSWDQSLSSERLSDEITRWRVIQYLCFSQFSKVRAAADASGVLLVGDLPLLISKDSVDVWRNRDLFVLSKDVGAPPDVYNKEGQRWGFPLYRWSAHQATNFSWWTERLRFQERLFHLYRLDHLVGFFRLYAINPGQKTGSFVPPNPGAWQALGEKLLRMVVGATTMLPLGEDLGEVPDFVRQTMQKLGIPGLKVLRWERRWHTDGSFLSPASFSSESVTTVSTHDSSTVRGWWAEEPLAAKRAAREWGLVWGPSLLFDTLLLSHRSGSLFHINPLGEYLSLFPELSWNDPEVERINRPGKASPLNWTYRMKVPVRTVIEHEKLLDAMRTFSA